MISEVICLGLQCSIPLSKCKIIFLVVESYNICLTWEIQITTHSVNIITEANPARTDVENFGLHLDRTQDPHQSMVLPTRPLG